MTVQGEPKGESESKPRGIVGAESTQIRWFSRISGGEAGLHEWWTKETQGGPSGSRPLRSDGSSDGKAGRLDRLTGGQRRSSES
jgi:hypothetical protein